MSAAVVLCLACFAPAAGPQADPLERIVVGPDGRSFVGRESGRPFRPRGFNYDHDRDGKLLEDYWEEEWAEVESDFEEIRDLGANVVRIHLQLAKFMDSPTEPNARALKRLSKLVDLAERTGLYLDLTGLGCYHKQDVPAWYDALEESERWEVQARFWRGVAEQGRGRAAVFCYDLMNEPVVPGGGERDDWLGGAFGDKHFVQFIALKLAGRRREEVARDWTRTLARAVREVDPDALVTVGLVHWSLPGKGLYSGFDPAVVAPELDFLCVHIYPERGNVRESLDRLAGFDVGKPVVLEETFPLKAGIKEFDEFLRQASPKLAGWLSFYWGKTIEEHRASRTIPDAMMREFLDYFVRTAGEN